MYGFPFLLLGSQEFAGRPRSVRLNRDEEPKTSHDRQLRELDVRLVWAAVAKHYGVDPEVLGERSRKTEIRSVAAWLAKRYPATTLRELASWLGLGRAQNASNLTRRVDESLTKPTAPRRTIQEIQTQVADWQQEKPKPRPGKKLDLAHNEAPGLLNRKTALIEPAFYSSRA